MANDPAAKRSRLSPDAITSKRLRGMWTDREFADAEVECGGTIWPVHRAVLASASSVLARMLSSEFREAKSRKVDLQDADPEAIGGLLEFIYTGDTPVLQEQHGGSRWSDEDSSRQYGALYEIKDDGRTALKKEKDTKITVCHERSGRLVESVYEACLRVDCLATQDPSDGIGFAIKAPGSLPGPGHNALKHLGSVCLSSNGQIFVHGDARQKLAPLTMGDVITLTLDGAKQTITFSFNGGKQQATEHCPFDNKSPPRLAVCFRHVGWQVTVLDRLDAERGAKLLALLMAAHMYEVRDLMSTCVREFIDRRMIVEDNVVAVLRVARDLGADSEFEDPLPKLQQLVAGNEHLFRALCTNL